MANENEEVKEFNEFKVMEPSAGGDDEIIEPIETEKETPAPSSEEEKTEPEIEEPDTEEEEQVIEDPVVEEIPKTEPDLDVASVEKYFGNLAKDSKRLPNETAREWALRLDNSRVKGELRKARQDDLFVKKPVVAKSPEEDLSEYDPEEVSRLKTILDKIGYVKKDEFVQQTVFEKNNTEFETFIEAHPEYSPDNDVDGVLWDRFKSEFSLYNPPQDPKTLRKILNKVHNEIYGIKPTLNLNKINAQNEKIKTASHTGKQGSRASISSPKAPNSNIRLDMLKGFSEEDLKELES